MREPRECVSAPLRGRPRASEQAFHASRCVILCAPAGGDSGSVDHRRVVIDQGGAMIKVVVLLRRPGDWSRERFHRWWLDEHVAHGKKLPGLRKYRVSLVTGSTTHEGRE